MSAPELASAQATEQSSEGHTPKAQPSAFAALRHRDFRLLWTGQFVSLAGSQMQLVAINWHVYLLTKSSVALGLVGLVRVVPIVLCSLVGGVVADAFDRKRLMVITQSTMLASACVLATATAAGLHAVWPIYLLTAIASAATAFDNPARQALLPQLVPARVFPNAVSLGLISFQIAMVTGPLLAGLVLAKWGPAIVYGVNAASFLAVIGAVLMLRARGRASDETQAQGRVSFAALTEGLKFVWRTPVVVQSMTLDFVATFFASATALLPIYADRILGVGARGLGVLAASPAIGAVIAGLAMARFGSRLEKPGATVLASIAAYGAATVLFGWSHLFWFSCLMLACVGAGDTVSTVLRQTMRQLITPVRLRGRMTSVNMIFFMGGPQLGELEAGLLAAAVGVQLSVIVGGVGCLLAVVLAACKARALLRYKLTDTAAHD